MLHATTFKTLVKNFSRRKIPKRIAQRFILDAAALDKVALSLKQHYFSHAYAEERQCSSSDVYLSSPAGRKDWIDHLCGRLGAFRETVVPWLNSAKSLSGATILEIGCGTGSSTVALAEQGAKVVAVDINQESLVVAEDRCNAYSLNVDFFNVNATEVHSLFSGRHFDFIIFFAALEHMTHDERMIAMKKTWDMLSAGGLWCVIETPNRLWFFDRHTSKLPFFLWLPDKLALAYSQFSPKESFSDSYKGENDNAMLHFLRRGRGVSFHEFALAMKPVEKLDVVSSLPIYLRKQSFVEAIKWRRGFGYQYANFLIAVGPKIHLGFYQQNLDLVIRKD